MNALILNNEVVNEKYYINPTYYNNINKLDKL